MKSICFTAAVPALFALFLQFGFNSQRVFSLHDYCVVITGASSGIGVDIAHQLVKEGASHVILAARRLDKLESITSGVTTSFPNSSVLPVKADVASAKDRKALLSRTLDFCPSSSKLVLVNNAGVMHWNALGEFTTSDIDSTISINLGGVIHMTHVFIGAMLQRGGAIVNMASVAGKTGAPYQNVYTASKHGVVGFTRSLRWELRAVGAKDVSAHVICPGWIGENREQAVGVGGPQLAGKNVTFEEVTKDTGYSTPAMVADAVVRAIFFDEPELFVNNPTIFFRILMVLQEVFPWLIDFAPIEDVWHRLIEK